jgi:pilus assembly protein CpaB
MKPARIIVLIIAVVAGGDAALLAGRSDPPAPTPPPAAQLETTDVRIANADIGLGTAVAQKDLRWQTWPIAAAGPSFIRKNERPQAIAELAGAIARVPFS